MSNATYHSHMRAIYSLRRAMTRAGDKWEWPRFKDSRVGQSEDTRGEAYIEARDTTPSPTLKSPWLEKISMQKNTYGVEIGDTIVTPVRDCPGMINVRVVTSVKDGEYWCSRSIVPGCMLPQLELPTTKPDPGKTSTEKNAEWSKSPPTLTGISPHLKQSIKDWPENLPEKKNTGGSK